jgi:polysaccharide biosynthesis/export protein
MQQFETTPPPSPRQTIRRPPRAMQHGERATNGRIGGWPSWLRQCSALTLAALLSGCAGSGDWLAASGPSYSQVESAGTDPRNSGIQIVDVTDAVARRLLARQRQTLFSEALGAKVRPGVGVGAGDVVEVTVWEAPPGMLFSGGSAPSPTAGPATAAATTFPAQMVNPDGTIGLPFVGPLPVAGRTTQQIEAELVRRLQGKANQPQALVRLTQNTTANVTVVGEVEHSARVPLTANGERLLDAVAAAGGLRQPLDKMTLQVTRGGLVAAMPMQSIVRDPHQNIPLQSGDVIAALYQPLSFTALGATGQNQEINFEAQGISLAQALARAGGLLDNRARASGAFLFRFENAHALDWAVPPVTTPDGKVAVIYRVNLRDPATFFAAQSFPVENKDILYVSNSSAAELQKFLNLIVSVVYPIVNVGNAANNLNQ